MASHNFNPQPEVYSRDQHPISRRHIDPDALKIMYRLLRHGCKAYLVGGSVRDLLLDKKPKDFDIVTDATPRRIKGLFRNSRIIGRRFKLVHVFFGGGKIIEVSTFRDLSDPIGTQENEEEAAAQVFRDNKYGTEITDAFRRDISINALFYNIGDFSLIDYVGGIRDLTDGIIRVIGDPDVRYAEDPIRMIRVVRHASRIDFKVEENCWEAIKRNHLLILHSAPMRLFEEFKKDLSSGYLLKFLRLMSHTPLLDDLLPELAHSDTLYDDRSPLAKYLGKVDELSLKGEPPSVAVILGILVSVLRADNSARPASVFRDEDDLASQVRSCFLKLAVPRREREKIQGVLSAWYYLETTPQDKIKFSRVNRREFFEDLIGFLGLMETDKNLLDRLEASRRRTPQTRPPPDRGKARQRFRKPKNFINRPKKLRVR